MKKKTNSQTAKLLPLLHDEFMRRRFPRYGPTDFPHPDLAYEACDGVAYGDDPSVTNVLRRADQVLFVRNMHSLLEQK